ncbi:hypothetical protein C4D60_Mb06t12090 [Musa balbisiana]|uniref:Uncharacterized protein n=1 Tax=Musa balbisiana TaxID=52838 RepID=A0A4S8IMF7_MUSBA|nr:hypothetical protein C4D60_Mb06t12090 [Musa balbisiana]
MPCTFHPRDSYNPRPPWLAPPPPPPCNDDVEVKDLTWRKALLLGSTASAGCRTPIVAILLGMAPAMDGFSSGVSDVLMKVIIFALVQALVYLILTKSSDVFSTNRMRSRSFRPARTVSVRRWLAFLSDMPPGGEASPSSSSSSRSPRDDSSPVHRRD